LPGVPAPGLSFNGGYVEAGWNIIGQPFRCNVRSIAFVRPKVDDPFIINEAGFSPGIGAWQLAARYSLMNLNSNVTPGVSQSVTGGVFGGYQRIFGAALSWYPNDWIRFKMQFQYSMGGQANFRGDGANRPEIRDTCRSSADRLLRPRPPRHADAPNHPLSGPIAAASDRGACSEGCYCQGQARLPFTCLAISVLVAVSITDTATHRKPTTYRQTHGYISTS
jgi:hypothetical protein